MTLKDVYKHTTQMDNHNSHKTNGTSLGEAVVEVIWQALEQGRLLYGVHGCAHQLEMDPYNIMLCILPADTQNYEDIATHINQMLIEACCREYDIHLIKVENSDKLENVIKKGQHLAPDNAYTASYTDVSCLTILYPEGSISQEEEIVAHFSDTSQNCQIALPD